MTLNLYSIDMKLCATLYVKASSAKEALVVAQAMTNDGLELREDEYNDPPISGKGFDSPDLKTVSLSPAMTVHGTWSGRVELMQEDVPAYEEEAR